MSSGYLVVASSLTILLALPVRAQRAMPIGAQRLDVAGPTTTARRDTLEQRSEPDVAMAVAGGIVGAVAGTALAFAVGQSVASGGCHGNDEFCGFGEAVVTFAVAEPLGVAIGTHYGAGGHGSVALASLASFGILVGGTMLGARAGAGGAMVIAIPALQIATSVALARD